jgi:hypothetical protein
VYADDDNGTNTLEPESYTLLTTVDVVLLSQADALLKYCENVIPLPPDGSKRFSEK